MNYKKRVTGYGSGGLHVTLSTKEFKMGDYVIVTKETELEETIRKIVQGELRETHGDY